MKTDSGELRFALSVAHYSSTQLYQLQLRLSRFPSCTTWRGAFVLVWNAARWTRGIFYWRAVETVARSRPAPSFPRKPVSPRTRPRKATRCSWSRRSQTVPRYSSQWHLSVSGGYRCGYKQGKASRDRPLLFLGWLAYLDLTNKERKLFFKAPSETGFSPFFLQPLLAP